MTLEKNYLHAIETCSEIIDAGGPAIGVGLRHDCLCFRAAAFLKVRLVPSVPPSQSFLVVLFENFLLSFLEHGYAPRLTSCSHYFVGGGSVIGKMMYIWQFETVMKLGQSIQCQQWLINIWPKLFLG